MGKKRSRYLSSQSQLTTGEHLSPEQQQVSTTNETKKFHRINRLERQHSEVRRRLPVYQQKNEICQLVTENDVVLVVAETVSVNIYVYAQA